MNEINCTCGVTYTPKDVYDKNRHEKSVKHQSGVIAAQSDTFDDLDPDLDDAPEPEPVVETPKPKRARKAKALTFADLDKTDVAKSFTMDERLQICNSVAATKSAHDASIPAKVVAESYVAAVIDKTSTINEAVLVDLQAYVEGVVAIIRAESNGETPDVEETPPTKKAPKMVSAKVKAAPAPVPAKSKPTKTKASTTGTTKICRTCKKDKPLEEFRRKASRPDGRDTNCAECSKNWFIANRAKKAATK
jgi:hypothetical protein